MEEIWKDYQNYKISSFGRVKNSVRITNGCANKKGYLTVGINGKTRYVHQLVAECFLGHKIDGMNLVVDHIDNDKTNNNINNLQIITPRLNASKDRKTKFTGVKKLKNEFTSLIKINKKQYNLGRFKTELEASEAYQKAVNGLE